MSRNSPSWKWMLWQRGRMATSVPLEATAVILVEGASDRVALELLAHRQGIGLDVLGIDIVDMGGATNARSYIDRYTALGLRLGGLGDIAAASTFATALLKTGLDRLMTVDEMREVGFHFCVVDLEDELIRALGSDQARAIVEDPLTPGTFASYQRQPAHRDVDLDTQLRGFVTNWKSEYARLFVNALDLDKAPRPLIEVLAHVAR